MAMPRDCRARRIWLLLAALAAHAAAGGPSTAQAETEARRERATPVQIAQRTKKNAQKTARDKEDADAKEVVEADVSTRTISITSGFSGTEIIVFGSVLNSRQPSAEAGYYDVIVVLEGMGTPVTARRKSNVAGLWVNTTSVDFESAPSYYAIASTRPIEEIAEDDLLTQHAIGHDFARLSPAARSVIERQPAELRAFKDAVIRLKQKEGLYVKQDYAVIFIGKGLFRSSISLPANVPVGPLTARVYLLREGELLSTFQQRVRLEREGIERWLYQLAMLQPELYGILAVVLAVAAGFAASTAFRRRDRA